MTTSQLLKGLLLFAARFEECITYGDGLLLVEQRFVFVELVLAFEVYSRPSLLPSFYILSRSIDLGL